MLELPNGRIKMTPDEEATYKCLSGLTLIPRTKAQFTQTLMEVAAAMRLRLAQGLPRTGDNAVNADLIEDYLASPHAADIEKRHRQWREAGTPFGEEAMRKAGLSSPALDRVARERAAHNPPWVTIQSALVQAELFDHLLSGRK